MKKAILIIAILMLIASPAMAAWTIDASVVTRDKDDVSLIKIEMTSDGATTSFNLFTYLDDDETLFVDGKYIWILTTAPDGTSAPDNVYTLTLTNLIGQTCTLTDRSATVTEDELGSDVSSTGHYMKIYNKTLTIASTDIGSAGDKTVLYLEVSK